MAYNPGHIQFINLINDDRYEKIMLCNNIANNIVQKADKDILYKLKCITTHV